MFSYHSAAADGGSASDRFRRKERDTFRRQPGTGKGPSVPQGRRAQGDELGNSSKRPNARGGGAWTLEIRGVRTARGVDREETGPADERAKRTLGFSDSRRKGVRRRPSLCPVAGPPPPHGREDAISRADLRNSQLSWEVSAPSAAFCP